MKERTKVFTLSDKRWQVKKIAALEGSDLIRMFTSSGAENPQAFLGSLSKETFAQIQLMLLNTIDEIQVINNEEVFIPITTLSGALSKSIMDDAGLLYMLTIVALAFNLTGFFEGNALKEFQEVISTINALNP